MKIKILVYIPKSETGMLIDLQPGEFIAVDDTVGEKLLSAGKAQFEF